MTAGGIANGVILGENDAVIRSIVGTLLRQAGQQVFLAADGSEAVLLARQFKARLVLLDIAMPRLNGLLACKAIRALPGYAEVPVVMLTGYGLEPVREAAQRVGASDFITKPFSPADLLARLAVHLDMPEHALPAGARVWDTHPESRPIGAENTRLRVGSEMVRIWRGAERNS